MQRPRWRRGRSRQGLQAQRSERARYIYIYVCARPDPLHYKPSARGLAWSAMRGWGGDRQ